MARAKNPNMRLFESEVSIPEFLDAFAYLEGEADELAYTLLMFVGQEVIRFLKDYTIGTRPPDYRVGYHGAGARQTTTERYIFGGSGRTERARVWAPASPEQKAPRPAHPGGWADISKDLMRHYGYNVEKVDGSWELSIINDSDHAAYVEAMNGFFVVTGVLKTGGPVEKALRQAIQRIAPDWVLEYSGGFDYDSGRKESISAMPRRTR